MKSKYLKLSDIYDEIQVRPKQSSMRNKDHALQDQISKNLIKNNTQPKATPLFQPTYQNCIHPQNQTWNIYESKQQNNDICLTSKRSLRKKKYFQIQNQQIFEEKSTQKYQTKQLIRSETVFSHYIQQKGILLTSKKSVPTTSKSTKEKMLCFSQIVNDEIYDIQPPIGKQSFAMKPKSMIN